LLFHRGQFYLERLRSGEARQLAERAIALAQSVDDQVQEAEAWYNLGESFFRSGDLLAAKARCQKVSELLAAVPSELLVQLFGCDMWIVSCWVVGNAELILGRPDRSLEWENRVVECTGSSSHMYSKALAMFAVSQIAAVKRDLSNAKDYARIARELSEEHGFAEVLNWAISSEGYVHFWQEEKELGVTQQKLANEKLEALGSRVFSSWRMACLAEAQLQIGELEAADSSLERAFEIVKETGEGWAEPEIHRIAAEAILHKPGGDTFAATVRRHQGLDRVDA
jgi:tetratricopeptide (TPR) repeat protein